MGGGPTNSGQTVQAVISCRILALYFFIMTANFPKFTSRRFLLSWMEQLFRLCANATIFAWMLIGKNIYGMIKLWSSLKSRRVSIKS